MTTSYGLTAAGFVAPRQADYLDIFRSKYEAALVALGYAQMPDWDRDLFLGQTREIVSYLLGQQGEMLQAVYDARVLGNATGVQLDNLALLVGVRRNDATHGTVTLTCSGTDGTVIRQGRIVQGGGSDGNARWVITSDGIIASGTCTVTAQAQETGEIVAIAGDIDTIVTPIAGWTSVTNAADATPGRDRESDAALRARRQARLAAAGATSCNAILSALLDIEGVTGAVVLDNKTGSTVTTAGVSIDPYAVACVVAPDSLDVATVGRAIYDRLGAGTATSGSETATITKRDGRSETIHFSFAADATVNVAWTLAMRPGYVAADVASSLQAAVADFFLTLGPGATVYPSPLIVLAMALDGVANVTSLLLNGGSSPVTHDADELPTLGTHAVS
jgi:uncharacterized phage protein gp47/JayE